MGGEFLDRQQRVFKTYLAVGSKLMKVLLKLSLFILASMFLSSLVYAKKIRTSYLEAEVPSSWSCQLKTGLWICEDFGLLKGSALFSLVAKEKTPEDSLERLLNNLKKEKKYQYADSQFIKSEVKKADYLLLGKRRWVEALHWKGEAPKYYTYYLGTVTDRRMILLSYSYHKDVSKEAEKVYKSLVESFKILDPKEKFQKLQADSFLGDELGEEKQVLPLGTQGLGEFSLQKDSGWIFYLLSLLAVVVIGLFVYFAFGKKS